MKKQNNIIADLESRTEVLGGEVRVERYITFGGDCRDEVRQDSNLMVSIGPKGAIKYCSWFFIDAPDIGLSTMTRSASPASATHTRSSGSLT